MDMGMVPIVQLAITMVIAERLHRYRNLVSIRWEKHIEVKYCFFVR